MSEMTKISNKRKSALKVLLVITASTALYGIVTSNAILAMSAGSAALISFLGISKQS